MASIPFRLRREWEEPLPSVVAETEEKAPPHGLLGRHLRARRISHGFDVVAVAARLLVSGEQLERWEAGEAEPTPPELRALGEMYDIPAAEVDRWIELIAEPTPPNQSVARRIARLQESLPAPPPDTAAGADQPSAVPVVRRVMVERTQEPGSPRPNYMLDRTERRRYLYRHVLVATTLAGFGLVLWWALGEVVAGLAGG